MTKTTTYAIFIAKFIFSLGLIFWTIKMTMSAGVGLDDDNTFFSTYHEIDDNFNQIAKENIVFNNKYDVKIMINDKVFNELSYKDIFLSQRVMKKTEDRKHILNNGDNKISLKIIDKKTSKAITDYKAEILVTTTVNHKDDIKFELKDGVNNFKIPKKSYWNIMGKITVGDDVGHFYIKTNSK